MAAFKEELEEKIPGLIWQRLEGKKASRIKLEMKKNNPINRCFFKKKYSTFVNE